MEAATPTYVLEKFVTTGSAIKRTDTEKVLPVTVFHTEQIEARNSSTGIDLLASIPQITSFPQSETTLGAAGTRGGNASASLRGLSDRNTLILLNGRRVAYTPFYASQGSANVNIFPVTGLSQIEVLRDGASSLYGADAVAGVINYITNSNLSGGTLSVRYFQPEHAGGKESNVTLSYGKSLADGKARFVANMNFLNRDAIYLNERATSDSPDHRDQARPKPEGVTDAAYATNYLNRYNGFSSSPYALPAFYVASSDTDATIPVAGNSLYMYTGANGLPVIPAAFGAASVPTAQYPNYFADKTTIGQGFSTRLNFYTRFEFDLTDTLTAFIEGVGYFAKTMTGRQPVATTWGDSYVTIGKDNPYNPYGSAFAGSLDPSGNLITTGKPLKILQKLMTEVGNERITGHDNVYRVLGGLRGKWGETWNWESALMFSEYRQTDVLFPAVRDSLARNAALGTTKLAWNPFGYTWKVDAGRVVVDRAYTNPPEVINSFTQRAKAESHTKMASWDFRTNGDIYELWAGPIKGAAGLEARYEQNGLQKPPYVGVNPQDGSGTATEPWNNDIMVMSPKYNYLSDRTLYAGYAETIFPLIAPKNDLKFTEALNLNASVRYEHYSDFGNATKPKVGVDWKVTKGLMVRASYNQGFLTPDLPTMYQPLSFTVDSPPGGTDTAYNTFFGTTSVRWPGTRNYSQPNADLVPEESEGLSAGVVFEVPYVKGLSVSVDYYQIEQKNLMVNANTIFNTLYDYQTKLDYTQAQLAAGKNILDINLGAKVDPNDTQAYVGNPYILRAAVRPDQIASFQTRYAALPQNQWIAPFGDLLGSVSQTVNATGKNFTNGFDVQVDYDLRTKSFGQFRFTTNWTKFINRFQKINPTSPKNDLVVAMELPEYRGNATIQWRKGAWNATVSGTYQSDIRTGLTFTAAQYAALNSPAWIIPTFNNGTTTYYEKGYDSLQVNLGLSYKFDSKSVWLKSTTVRLGVNNVLDEDPPLNGVTTTGYAGSTGSSLWIGRAYSVNLTRTF